MTKVLAMTLTFPLWEAPSLPDVTHERAVRFEIKVTKMNCGGCAKSVTRAIHGVDADATVAVDLAEGTVAVTSPAETPAGRFVDAVRAAGYGADKLPLAA